MRALHFHALFSPPYDVWTDTVFASDAVARIIGFEHLFSTILHVRAKMPRRRTGSQKQQLEDILRIPCGVTLTHLVLRQKDCLIIRQALRNLGLERIAIEHQLETSVSLDVLIAAFVSQGWAVTSSGTTHELSRGDSKVSFPGIETELRVRLTGDVAEETGMETLVLEPVACLYNQRWTCFGGGEEAVKDLLTEITFSSMGVPYPGSRLFKLGSPLQFRFINMGG